MCNSREEFQMETMIEFPFLCMLQLKCAQIFTENKKQIKIFQAIKDKFNLPFRLFF